MNKAVTVKELSLSCQFSIKFVLKLQASGCLKCCIVHRHPKWLANNETASHYRPNTFAA